MKGRGSWGHATLPSPARRELWAALAACGAALLLLWRSLRQWSGDAAYEIYLSRAGEGEPLDRKAFYVDSLLRRYRGQPDRCC